MTFNLPASWKLLSPKDDIPARCGQCQDRGYIAVMGRGRREKRWMPEWYLCECPASVKNVYVEDKKTGEKHEKSMMRYTHPHCVEAMNKYDRPDSTHKIIRHPGKQRPYMWSERHVFLLEYGLNDRKCHQPLDPKGQFQTFVDIQWLVPKYISDSWVEFYMDGPEKEEIEDDDPLPF
jgi:hypothetical protein